MRVTREGENRLKALSPMYSRTPASSSEISPFFLKNAPDTQGIFLFGISGMRLYSELYVWLLAEHTCDSMASTLPTCDALFFFAGDKRKPNLLAPVVQSLDSAIHRIKIYPVDSAIGFRNTYPLDSAIQRLNNRGQVVIAHTLPLCSQHSFGLQLIMNGMQITQFDHTLLDPLSLVIWSRVFWLSITARETYAKHSDGEKAFRCRPHSVTIGYY